ncbi:MAG: Fatty acid desaturase [Verrucomicrobiae bacterium]|nr:Fatty acid desaturase [Verrucomicrobiae bacterium]
MSQCERNATSEAARRTAVRLLADAVRPSAGAAWREFAVTLASVVASWVLAAWVVFPVVVTRDGAWWLAWLASCLMMSVSLVRLFVVQHDAGHGGLSPSKPLNHFIGHVCSVFEFTPFLHWHRHHWHHHRTAGHLEKQDGLGDIYTLSVADYRRLKPWQQAFYRLVRNRVHFFLIMPTNLFLFLHRFPLVQFPLSPIKQKPSASEWVNILALDVVYVALGWWAWTHWEIAQPWVISYGIAFVVAATIGIVLFYTQHQFETTYYARDGEWSFYESSMKGSMTLRLPFVWMEWLIGYINYHSIHHLKPNIPMYDLRRCYVALSAAGIRMAECRLGEIWKTFDLALWDEAQQRMVCFTDVETR